MKNMIRSLILVPAVLCASAAFAADTTTLNVPFSFTAYGTSYPAGKYTVAVNLNDHTAKLSSATLVSKPIDGLLKPADGNPSAPAAASLEFSSVGSSHQLTKIKYGSFSTSNMVSADRKSNADLAQVAGNSATASNGR